MSEIAALSESTCTTVRIEQIEEKFGGLRIYVFVDEPSARGFELVDNKPGRDRFRTGATPGSVRAAVQHIIDTATECV